MAGRPPTPLAIRERLGNPHKKAMPDPLPDVLPDATPPAWLTAVADTPKDNEERASQIHQLSRAIHSELAEQLARIGLLTGLDKNLFGVYCSTLAHWVMIKAFIDQNGLTYPVYSVNKIPVERVLEDGTVERTVTIQRTLKGLKTYPQAKLYTEFGNTINRMSREFGLTPAVRSRLVVPSSAGYFSAEPDDDFLD